MAPIYVQSPNISRTLGNKIIDHSDVVGAKPMGNYIFIFDFAKDETRNV